ncbi:hypothetical protein Thiowin_00132 [Thiorhodovibrio winogradskyi]|uniref:dTDP-4-dehydrorhamnose 3,5-epimerase n=1 Tax=Thiorhodovibrio winogradskyi TaxID=77007 RepID=A0ABZ0S3R3_9GAMM|nr:hypothetical protein [Thiorhodovibrio winogradskyi]
MPSAVESLAIPAVNLVHPKKHADGRGFFSETYSQGDLAAAGIDIHFGGKTREFQGQFTE